MKPYGYKRLTRCDCAYCTKTKKAIRHKSKLKIKKELNYDILDDIEKEY